MYEKPRIISASGRIIKIAHLDLPAQPVTYLLSDVAVAGTTLTVLDNAGFADNNVLLVGKLGYKSTEIKQVDAAVVAGTSITSSAVTFAHSAGTPITKLLFDQFKIYGTATDTYATTNLVATVDIAVDAPHTVYVNASVEYAYYWATAYDSLNTVTGVNSDSILVSTGYPPNSVGYLINSALEDTKKKKGGVITDEWFFRQINEGAEFIAGKLKHWSFLQNFDYSLGTSLRGAFEFTMPTDIGDKNTIKSILGVRVGTDDNLTYLDKREWETKLEGVALTEVTTEAAAADTELEIDNSYDFADSGSVDVFISGTKYTYDYGDITFSTTAGILEDIAATEITVTTPVDTNVWQGEDEGQPEYFTVYDGKIFIYPLPDATYDYKNITMDYWTSRTLVDSASDTIEPPRYDALKEWLNFKLRGLDNASGKLDFNDSGFVMFNNIVNTMISKEISGQKFKWKRTVNKITL